MQAYVAIGANCEYKLSEAVLVYRAGTGGAFASLHQVKQGDTGVPYLAPGEPLTTAFVRTLAEGLGAQVKPETLPDNVLARTPDLLVWWSRPNCRVMFFGGTDQEARKLNGLVFPHPALVFKVVGKDLFVRAMTTSSRPIAETPLKTAPYWNTDSRGLVCAGSMRVPESSEIASVPAWEEAYFQSKFTHAAGAIRLTSHPGGFIGLWKILAGRKSCPVQYLTDAGETLQEFVVRGSERYGVRMETHRIHPELLERQVRVLVVGCGGTGSAVVAGLPYLHQSLMARGHPGGLHVTVMDGDAISPANCIRQHFARSEVGLNKAVVLVNRLNLFWGLKWEAVPAHLKPGSYISRSHSGDDLRAHIVLGCVDTRAARATIRDTVSRWSTVSYWLDLGNNADSGQFILGEPLNERNRRSRLRLRSADELYPEIVDPGLDDDGQPSCSAAAALERQEPFINSTLAQHALALLARLFRYGTVCYHGGFISLSTGVSSRLPIDTSLWRRLQPQCKRERSKA